MLAIPSLLVRAVEVIDESEELGENVAGGVAVGDTAHRQRIALGVLPEKRVSNASDSVVVELCPEGCCCSVTLQQADFSN